ncbi:MAG: hypothetical protein J4G13_10555 [Dehalococcoidia bacterium]|nr:hypothetical protein [Dehalococcoidia bacterium]
MAIFFLAKFIKKQEHADEFLQGKLFLNPLCYFKNIESEDGRGDKNEGAILFPLDDFVLTLTPTNPKTGDVGDIIRITKDDLAAPISLHPGRFDHINLLCMYACHIRDIQSISVDNIDDFRKQLEISEECASLGEHAIIITNIQEFLRRISVAAEQGGYGLRRGLVTYYDPMVGTPTTESDIESVFHKRKEYQYQSEFRIAVDTHLYEPTSLRLSIGDISDIAFLMRTSEINGQMRFEVGPR